jgi:hypothetical protein
MSRYEDKDSVITETAPTWWWQFNSAAGDRGVVRASGLLGRNVEIVHGSGTLVMGLGHAEWLSKALTRVLRRHARNVEGVKLAQNRRRK